MFQQRNRLSYNDTTQEIHILILFKKYLISLQFIHHSPHTPSSQFE